VAPDFSTTANRVLATAAGAILDHSWFSPDRGNFVVRYSAGGRGALLVVSAPAANVLGHWSADDVDGLLQSYRVVEGVDQLEEDAVFFVRTSDGPATTFKEQEQSAEREQAREWSFVRVRRLCSPWPHLGD
jgi:hypothetical protein